MLAVIHLLVYTGIIKLTRLLSFCFAQTGRDYIWGTGKVGVKCEGE